MKINNFWCCFILSVTIALASSAPPLKTEGMIEASFSPMGELSSKTSENEENEFYATM